MHPLSDFMFASQQIKCQSHPCSNSPAVCVAHVLFSRFPNVARAQPAIFVFPLRDGPRCLPVHLSKKCKRYDLLNDSEHEINVIVIFLIANLLLSTKLASPFDLLSEAQPALLLLPGVEDAAQSPSAIPASHLS